MHERGATLLDLALERGEGLGLDALLVVEAEGALVAAAPGEQVLQHGEAERRDAPQGRGAHVAGGFEAVRGEHDHAAAREALDLGAGERELVEPGGELQLAPARLELGELVAMDQIEALELAPRGDERVRAARELAGRG
ncbi:MAG: hypothetical protein ABL998_11740, partial [Planctomycetota bacterium]